LHKRAGYKFWIKFILKAQILFDMSAEVLYQLLEH